jgi:hypothetical protein
MWRSGEGLCQRRIFRRKVELGQGLKAVLKMGEERSEKGKIT